MPSHSHRQSWRSRLAALLAHAWRTRTRTYGDRSLLWRLLGPAVFVAAGVLFVTSMVSSQGTDLRAGRVRRPGRPGHQRGPRPRGAAGPQHGPQPAGRPAHPRPRQHRRVKEQQKVAALRGPAGLRPVRAPASRSPSTTPPTTRSTPPATTSAELLVHQQDIQAVANALWAGGAEAMTIQGQRVVATTGIKCVGNTVILHGVPYSPPYRISAIGPTAACSPPSTPAPTSRSTSSRSRKGLGWNVKEEQSLSLPGYDGSTDLEYARPARRAVRDRRHPPLTPSGPATGSGSRCPRGSRSTTRSPTASRSASRWASGWGWASASRRWTP